MKAVMSLLAQITNIIEALRSFGCTAVGFGDPANPWPMLWGHSPLAQKLIEAPNCPLGRNDPVFV